MPTPERERYPWSEHDPSTSIAALNPNPDVISEPDRSYGVARSSRQPRERGALAVLREFKKGKRDTEANRILGCVTRLMTVKLVQATHRGQETEAIQFTRNYLNGKKDKIQIYIGDMTSDELECLRDTVVAAFEYAIPLAASRDEVERNRIRYGHEKSERRLFHCVPYMVDRAGQVIEYAASLRRGSEDVPPLDGAAPGPDDPYPYAGDPPDDAA